VPSPLSSPPVGFLPRLTFPALFWELEFLLSPSPASLRATTESLTLSLASSPPPIVSLPGRLLRRPLPLFLIFRGSRRRSAPHVVAHFRGISFFLFADLQVKNNHAPNGPPPLRSVRGTALVTFPLYVTPPCWLYQKGGDPQEIDSPSSSFLDLPFVSLFFSEGLRYREHKHGESFFSKDDFRWSAPLYFALFSLSRAQDRES